MNVFSFSAHTLDGQDLALNHYAGQVLLIVNTASQCGYTPQYAGLEELQKNFHAQGFSVLGFPCNQFGFQEPGDAQEIAQFCERRFAVSFPLFEKINVNGRQAHPLFRHLKTQAPGLLGSKMIKWNFTKFLVRRDGTVYKRYPPTSEPAAIIADIQHLLDSPT